MKFGPLNITFGQAKPTTQEIGSTGTEVFAGKLATSDYNFQLQPPECYAIYDRMRKGDGQVRAALTVIKLPLVNATWKVESASDSALDRMIAEILEEDLFENMSTPFDAWLRQALLHLDYGNMVFEECWQIGEDGLVRLKKLAPRLPGSITEWLTDDAGELAGIKQQASPTFTPITIPAEKLLVFTNELEGSDFRGTSILRSAYKHWSYVDGLERVAAIAMEKRALGVDVGTLAGESNTAAKKEEMERALMTLHAHEKQYFVEQEGQTTYRLETGDGRLPDPLPLIQHHNLQIVRSMIAEFVAMGAGSTGSLAMHRDKTSYLLLALGGIADSICDTVRQYLFKRWVGYNWDGARAPRLRYTRLEQRDVKTYAEAVERLARSGALTADETLETESRDLLSLPERVGPRVALRQAQGERGIDEDVEEMDTNEVIAALRANRIQERVYRKELRQRQMEGITDA